MWRWVTGGSGAHLVVKFELLADLDDTPAQAIIKFDGCDDLGAVNLRGTGFASEDVEVRELRARVGGVEQRAAVNVTGLAGFLMAKCAAAQARRASKDWYDIAFVLLHNDAGGAQPAAHIVRERFGSRVGAQKSALDDLLANFAVPSAQGPTAYAEQLLADHPELDCASIAADAVLAVEEFHQYVYS